MATQAKKTQASGTQESGTQAVGTQGSGTQAVDRAARLLGCVVRTGAVSFTDLVEECGYARSTTSRLLAALERGALLTRDLDGAFVPGPLFEVYAAGWDGDAALVEAARAELVALGEETGETINLAVVRFGEVVQIDQVDSTYFLGSRDWVGVDVPAHASALGKVFHAWGALPVPEGELEQLTDVTVSCGADLAAQLPGIRRRGWASTVDELELGLTGVAAPVVVDGGVVAALGLSGPTSRIATTISTTGSVVAAHARALSTRLRRTGTSGAGRRKEGAA